MNMNPLAASIDLPITIGTELLVEFQDFTLRTKSELVGMRHNQYLIIMMQHDMTGIRQDVLKESQLIIRYLYRGSVYGFRTNVMNTIASPERLVFLSYPKKIEEFRVRSSPRYECILPAATSVEGLSADTVVIDISMDGCRCIVKSASLEDAEAFYKTMDINREATLKVQFPGVNESYELTGSIRNISKDADRVAFGMLFGSLKDKAKKRLEDFISLISEVKKKEG
ncbi:Cyclic di-GMP binding protein [Gammaproteobacteria bacterium]|nr:Cyclic di-GMP binding protein [Gammaproteobacteria bacterium]